MTFLNILKYFPIIRDHNFLQMYNCSWKVISGWGATGGEMPAEPPSTPGFPTTCIHRQLRYMIDAAEYFDSRSYEAVKTQRNLDYTTDEEYADLTNSSSSENE